MKQHSTPCSDDQLRALLQIDEDNEDSRRSALHVDECPHCQSRLEQLAAEPALWKVVKESLRSDEDEDFQNISGTSGRPRARQHWHRHPNAWSESMARQLLSPPSHPEMLGRIGRYEVERLIGVGGMGVVFKAFDTELNRPVAVKVLAPYLAGNGAARKRFAREARAAAAVVHEHVVAIHNVETEGEAPFLVMQFVAGESLQQRIDREGPLDLCEILRIAMQTAAGLAAAHAQGLVHRDVKPSNILLEQGIERTLLTDFGLARASDDASLTHTGYHPGTPQYMSPEQACGESVDARSDLFSLGSVIYAMCTGRAPFRAETNYGVLRRITDNEPRWIREVNAAIPVWLEAIVGKLLAKNPAKRCQTADQVAELLESCLAHVQQPATVSLPAELLRLAGQPSAKGPHARRAIQVGASFAVVLAAVVGALTLWSRQNPPAPTTSNTSAASATPEGNPDGNPD
ncbi:MAG: protein kinase, partial [Planctomycetales bacterium]|nr:protein kinase [Planctomycetales bacterium]